MCGRYVNVSKVQVIEKKFNLRSTSNDRKYKINFNVSHGDIAPVITNENPNELSFFQFGFTPSWAKKQTYIVNARAEGDNNKENDPYYSAGKGIISKPMFRDSIRNKRCLVIADCFYEGPEDKGLSEPYLVYLRDKQRPFAFAGIWDSWYDEKKEETIYSYAIITTVANTLMQKIGHHRSPVILTGSQEKLWLGKTTSLSIVTSMLYPFDSNKMNAYRVSPMVKNPRNKGAELIQPLEQPIAKEYDFITIEEIKLFGMGAKKAERDMPLTEEEYNNANNRLKNINQLNLDL